MHVELDKRGTKGNILTTVRNTLRGTLNSNDSEDAMMTMANSVRDKRSASWKSDYRQELRYLYTSRVSHRLHVSRPVLYTTLSGYPKIPMRATYIRVYDNVLCSTVNCTTHYTHIEKISFPANMDFEKEAEGK